MRLSHSILVAGWCTVLAHALRLTTPHHHRWGLAVRHTAAVRARLGNPTVARATAADPGGSVAASTTGSLAVTTSGDGGGNGTVSETFVVPFYMPFDWTPNVATKSDTVSAAGQQWKVQLYPGGNKRKGGVGMYLEFLAPDRDTACDATFTLTLLGKQAEGPKFDLEWWCGMRFVHPSRCASSKGEVADWGAHLLRRELLLPNFVDDDGKIEVKVSVTVHRVVRLPPQERGPLAVLSRANGLVWSQPRDIREAMHVGQVVVPVWRKFDQRQRLFGLGSYPGVDYRVMGISDDDGNTLFDFEPGCTLEVRPLYPLIQRLERSWPVEVNERDLPRILTQSMYNTLSVGVSASIALSALSVAYVLSQLLSFYYIPSRSMENTLRTGDVLLVEKLQSKVGKAPQTGEIVLFPKPAPLKKLMQERGARLNDRDLFVKRVAAVGGDSVKVDTAGRVEVNGQTPPGPDRELCEAEPLGLIRELIHPDQQGQTVPPKEVFLLGDCAGTSVDSRVWGSLPSREVVGRPLLRIWPFERFGRVE